MYGVARLYDVETGQEVRAFKGQVGFINTAVFSRDGKYAATTDLYGDAAKQGSSIHLWDVATGRELRRYPKHPSPPQRLAFTPDGRSLLSAYQDGPIWVWETGLPPAKP
jgi:WD40 repeat protein